LPRPSSRPFQAPDISTVRFFLYEVSVPVPNPSPHLIGSCVCQGTPPPSFGGTCTPRYSGCIPQYSPRRASRTLLGRFSGLGTIRSRLAPNFNPSRTPMNLPMLRHPKEGLPMTVARIEIRSREKVVSRSDDSILILLLFRCQSFVFELFLFSLGLFFPPSSISARFCRSHGCAPRIAPIVESPNCTPISSWLPSRRTFLIFSGRGFRLQLCPY